MRFIEDQPSPRVVFERGAVTRVAEEALALGAARILLVTSPSASPIASDLCGRFGDAVVGRVTDVEQHVPARRAHEVRELASERGADLLVPIGGGSAVGLAKAVALFSAVPILAVPTTYSGSEMTPIWGMTSGGRKRTGRNPRMVPRTVVYDPRLTLGLPPSLTATSGLNSVAHCIEARYSSAATPMSSAIAGEAVTLMPHVAAFNAAAAPDAMARTAQALGAQDAVDGLFALAAAVGAPQRLSELGVPERSLGEVAEASVVQPIRKPRPVSPRQALEMLRSAWRRRSSSPKTLESHR